MTDRNKFEEMLERLVNEDRAGAEELFHEIVVEKSREIYQAIIESEEDEEVDEAEENDDEEVDEAAEEDDEELDESADEDEDMDESMDDDDLDEMFGLDEFAPGDGSDKAMGMMGGDATDNMIGDVGMDDMDGMEGDDEGSDAPATKSDVMDIADALEELKAQFQAMLGDEDGDDMEGDDDAEGDFEFGDEGDDEGDDEEADDAEDDEETKEHYAFEAKKSDKKDEKKDKKTAAEQMREYVEKVAPAKMGDNGTNAKSIVASKNDMGGSAANIVRGDTESGVEANKGHLKGSSVFKGTPKEDNAGNINVPGGKAGKTAFKKSEPGHGAEKKGKPETADKSAGSTIKGVVRKG
jgi:hypothetical protein